MSLQRVDQDELLTALHAGSGGTSLAVFLDRFRRRVGAREALLVRRSDRFGWITERARAASGATIGRRHEPALLGLRPGRVYGLADIDPSTAEHGRIVRSAGASGSQWLVALGAKREFGASASALMSNLAQHVAIACDNRNRLKAALDDLSAASAALARGGVGWALVDGEGARVAGDEPPAGRRDLTILAATIAAGSPQAVRGGVLALRHPRGEEGRAVVLFRVARQAIDPAAVFAAEHGVPPSEARLAVALAEGLSITEAAQRLGITVETARNYSKRLYAQTGTHGQADLVRRIFTGLAALA